MDIIENGFSVPPAEQPDFQTEIEQIQATFIEREFKLYKPESEFPELFVTVPDAWEKIILAPLYDVHEGSPEHDAPLYARHKRWIGDEPNVLTFDGGDMFDNGTKDSPGASSLVQLCPAEEQLLGCTRSLAPLRHKMLFKLPGNHEDRTFKTTGMDSGRRLADYLKIPYFPDYCFCTIRWRGNNFRILAHHGSGAATTAGAQRNAARKDMPWAKFDIYWTGHLHQPLVDPVYQTDVDQQTGLVYERSSLVVISPSYVKYFGGYAAKKRLAPGARGLHVVTLNEDGRIDANVHARGKRL